MQKIIPHLWFAAEASAAAKFYTSVFADAKILETNVLSGTPSGEVETVTFEIAGCSFQAISAGPLFVPNPSISFMLYFDPSTDAAAQVRLDTIWEQLAAGGTIAMPLDTYPFSDRYGWVQDKYGVSWQLILTDPEGAERPDIVPTLFFVTEGCNKAEEATDFYLSVFQDAKRGTMTRYPAGMEPNKEGSIMFTDFQLAGQWFAAMDGSNDMHHFSFNEAISLMVICEDQAEIDYYWEQLSAVPEAEQCGWVKDAYGVSWQIVPRVLHEMLGSGDAAAVARVTKAFLRMKKFDLKELEAAYKG